MIFEQSLDRWDINPVKFSKVKYPQTKDESAPKNFFLAIFCGSRGSGKTYSLTKLLKLLAEKKIYYEGQKIPQRIILICSTAHSDSNRAFKSLKKFKLG
jgi:predicted AAA+ superfamily ATPase